jgi:isocitrate dehydrogenase kinase/phosphatase
MQHAFFAEAQSGFNMGSGDACSLAASLTLEAFESYNTAFQSITRRAKHTFEARDWQAGRRDAAERLDLYEKSLEGVAGQLDHALGEQAQQESLWRSAKSRFAALVAQRYDIDRAETFFNSVTRRMLSTVGVNREVEFFYLHPKATMPPQRESVYRTYTSERGTRSLVSRVLEDFHFWVGYENLERDVDLIAQEVDLYVWPLVGNDRLFSIDVAKAVFYRNKAAYIVGRIVVDQRVIPVIIPLINRESGICVDTVLLHESEADIVFSFAYSYFHVDLERYDALIHFLHSIMPGADRAELYTSLGYNRHGKTEFYRDLHRFVHVSREQFVIAPGLEGAVMIVFTLPNYEFVFKVIKDRPCFLRSKNETPKETTKDQVRYQYSFVSHRDPAGRMVDTQEFENLRFKKKRFSEALLDEFVLAAKDNITITDDYVILHHLYVQRKVVPLPLYFQLEKNPESIRHGLIDFGYFLKDLAASGVFPCDLFNIWNYGVTDWGRVVLFDYDDVLPIERITFRVKPAPRNEFEESEPEENWIVATQEDFFMDEIDRYSGVPQPLKGVFKSVHADLYTLEFWNDLTEKLRNGEVFDVIPYDRNKRFQDRNRTM